MHLVAHVSIVSIYFFIHIISHVWFTNSFQSTSHQLNTFNLMWFMLFRYWTEQKIILKDYTWKDYVCDFNVASEIQGYICEGQLPDQVICETFCVSVLSSY
jgi:hypothetical protein